MEAYLITQLIEAEAFHLPVDQSTSEEETAAAATILQQEVGDALAAYLRKFPSHLKRFLENAAALPIGAKIRTAASSGQQHSQPKQRRVKKKEEKKEEKKNDEMNYNNNNKNNNKNSSDDPFPGIPLHIDPSVKVAVEKEEKEEEEKKKRKEKEEKEEREEEHQEEGDENEDEDKDINKDTIKSVVSLSSIQEAYLHALAVYTHSQTTTNEQQQQQQKNDFPIEYAVVVSLLAQCSSNNNTSNSDDNRDRDRDREGEEEQVPVAARVRLRREGASLADALERNFGCISQSVDSFLESVEAFKHLAYERPVVQWDRTMRASCRLATAFPGKSAGVFACVKELLPRVPPQRTAAILSVC